MKIDTKRKKRKRPKGEEMITHFYAKEERKEENKQERKENQQPSQNPNNGKGAREEKKERKPQEKWPNTEEIAEIRKEIKDQQEEREGLYRHHKDTPSIVWFKHNYPILDENTRPPAKYATMEGHNRFKGMIGIIPARLSNTLTKMKYQKLTDTDRKNIKNIINNTALEAFKKFEFRKKGKKKGIG